MKTPHTDIYQQVTDSIIATIESGVSSWKMPWHRTGKDVSSPINAATHRPYRGINIVGLWAAATAANYTSGSWATYRQWSEMGAQVRKGEKGTVVVFWKFFDRDCSNETQDDAEEGQAHTRRAAFARGYVVFNADQVDGYTLPVTPERPELERDENAERFFSALHADVRHGGNRAYYSPAADYVQVPPFQSFIDAQGYYSTLGHELTHWCGAKERLNRNLTGRFGDAAYAGEELIAELGAAFLAAELGIENTPREDHAAYVQSWLQILRKDKRAIFTAASQAQQAVDWMREEAAISQREAA